MNLSRIVERWAGHFPDKVALHFHGTDYTYARLWDQVERVSRSIQVGKGDRIAWLGLPRRRLICSALAG